MTAKTKRKRRWCRFQLSTLLIAMTLFGGFFAIKFLREPLSMDNLSQLQKGERIDLDIWKVAWSPNGAGVLHWSAGRSRSRFTTRQHSGG